MKIKRIKIENNAILRNIDLNFTKSNGEVYENIILIGENGSGKSTLLDIIYQTGSRQTLKLNEGEKRCFSIILTDVIPISNGRIEPGEYDIILDETYTNQAYINSEDFYKHLKVFKNTGEDIARKFLAVNGNIFKSIFSDTSINFSSKVDRTTNIGVDEKFEESKKSDEKIAQDVSQALVDIDTADALDYTQWSKEHIGEIIDENQFDKRGKRFKQAFNEMFEESGLIYQRVENLQPVFEKNGSKIPINNLSSGEKQIVFRGSFFLKDKNSIKGCLGIVDEPEISMHPKRQIKILDYYKNLFKDENGVQTSQLFITTHSPYVLRGINKETDCIFIFPGGKKVDNIRHYLGDTPSLSVVNYIAYDLPSNELHDELYSYIQVKSSNYREEDLDNFLSDNGIDKNIPWIWESNGVVQGTYDVTLQTFIRNKIHHPENQSMQNATFTDEKLKESIEKMITFIDSQGW